MVIACFSASGQYAVDEAGEVFLVPRESDIAARAGGNYGEFCRKRIVKKCFRRHMIRRISMRTAVYAEAGWKPLI